MRRLWAVALLVVSLAGCADGSRDDAQVAKASRIAAQVFASDLDTLAQRAGVQVSTSPGGTRGCPSSCPTTTVTVASSAATGPLAFEALLVRLEQQGWSLSRTASTADACTAGAQALPCQFRKGESDGVVIVTPGPQGSYAVSTAAEAP